MCHQGTCVSACNPACAANEVCTSAGECVSRCNPPCAAGEACGADGACRPPAHGLSEPVGPKKDPRLLGASADRASRAGTLGVVTAAVLAASTIALLLAPSRIEVRLPIGIVAGVFGGIAIPLVATGSASARKGGLVSGHPTFRRSGWIAFVTAMCEGVLLIALTLGDVDVPVAAGGSAMMLVAASSLFFALDAFESAQQLRDLTTAARAGDPRLWVGLARDPDGGAALSLGLVWSF
jgi:hypothetical protein